MRIWAFFLFLITSVGYAQNVKTYIPPRAFEHRSTIAAELDRYFPTLYDYNYVPALIEHESCITLTHSRCWKSTSQLKTAREQGVGLGQITRAFNPDGSVRFDSLGSMRAAYREELKDVSWENIQYRPEVQIRIIVLMLRDDYKKLYSLHSEEVRLQMTDSAYNGGLRDVHRARTACGLAKDCDPQRWFEHTERYSPKSTKILYGNRSAKDINLQHVRDVFLTRLPKYRQQYFTQ